MTFGERLTSLRKEHGYATRNDFAEKLGIPSTTLRNYETNVREPGHTFLKQISELFNVSVDYLLCLTDDKEVLNSFRLRSTEQNLIEKYRTLDDLGRSHIDQMMDWETDRVKIKEKHSARIDELEKKLQKSGPVLRIYPYLRKIAAAGNGFYFDDIPTDTIEAPYMEGADFVIGVNGDSMEPVLSDGDLIYVEKRQIVETGDIGIFIVNSQCYVKKAADEGLVSYNQKYPTIPGTEHIICFGKVLGKVPEDQIKIRTRYTS